MLLAVIFAHDAQTILPDVSLVRVSPPIEDGRPSPLRLSYLLTATDGRGALVARPTLEDL